MEQRGDYNHPFIAETYDFVVPYRERKDVGFFVDMALESGGLVLELGCGTGRILIPTARAGISIWGLDASGEMLRVCRERLALEAEDVRERVRLERGDMRDYAIEERFRLITVPFRAFHHLIEVDDQRRCLDCSHRHLESRGLLLLDLFNPYLPYLYDKRFLEVVEEEPSFTLPNGQRMMRRSRLLGRDLHRQVLDMEFLYEWKEDGGQTHRHSHQFQMRYFFRYEIEHLLGRAGFALETIYADYKKSPFGSQYPGELIVVARKS